MARNKTTRVTRSAAAARVREHGGNTKDTNAEGLGNWRYELREQRKVRYYKDDFSESDNESGSAAIETKDFDVKEDVEEEHQIVKDGGRNTARISPAPESAATAVSRTKQEAKEAKEAKEARRARALKNAKPQSALSKVEQDEAVINRRISNPKLRSMLRSYKPRGPPRNRARTGFNLTDRHGKTMMR